MGRYFLSIAIIIGTICLAYAQGDQTVRMAIGSTVTLHANSTHALSYLWFKNGEPINGIHENVITVSEAGTYTVMALGHICNSDLSDAVIVEIQDGEPPITVDLHIENQPDRGRVLLGNTFAYQVLVKNLSEHTATEVKVTVRLPRNISYDPLMNAPNDQISYDSHTHEILWQIAKLPATQTESISLNFKAESDGWAEKIAVVSSLENDHATHNNEASASVEVVSLSIPNLFTPNGDGMNDNFVIRGLDLFQHKKLTVFNRWGAVVYEDAHYQNNWNGGQINEGTYYYILEIIPPGDQNTQVFKGFVTLVRNVQGRR